VAGPWSLASGYSPLAAGRKSEGIDRLLELFSLQIPKLYVFRTKMMKQSII
jgi:hypothetical protein